MHESRQRNLQFHSLLAITNSPNFIGNAGLALSKQNKNQATSAYILSYINNRLSKNFQVDFRRVLANWSLNLWQTLFVIVIIAAAAVSDTKKQVY